MGSWYSDSNDGEMRRREEEKRLRTVGILCDIVRWDILVFIYLYCCNLFKETLLEF